MRRGVGLLLLSAIAPGSAQLAVGHRRVGRLALRIWGAVLGLGLLLALIGLLSWSALVTVVANPLVLALLVVVLVGGALGWIVLFIDAWRLSYPPGMDRRHRQVFAAVTLALVVLVGSSYGLGARAAVSSTRTLGAVFTGGGSARATDGRVNVLLLGADAGQSRVGLRPDSITVASVDVRTGRTVLFSLPRNLEDVPFPEDSPMHERYPDGFSCPDHSCLLNAVYTTATQAAEQDPKVYKGVADPGAQATKEAVEATTGLTINYYAMVDMAGFSGLVDALGGITLDITRDVPIGGGSSPILGWIRAGQGVHLDGYHALWFARSREGSNDFERMQRQKCVMAAVLHQADPVTMVAKFDELATAGGRIVVTDVPRSDVGRLSDLALKSRALPITSVSFVPPLVYPGNPKFDVVRTTVKDHIRTAEDLDRQAQRDHTSAAASTAPRTTAPAAAPVAAASTAPNSTAPAPVAPTRTSGAPEQTKAAAAKAGAPASTAPETDDLDVICRVASAG
ncbi:cell envelope-related function transcriptional attenuator common domain-containing protein [Raineyella antarctica]|uniref:Cell envelope-related function transcriptional attenuator common domain-containing protein n=1 Tax=Raineyella antarctica TaxID=1577474 RepID=A0A1G6H4I2_9ACTN|nr:cell envelope-related function transcriptional attenuator common domain-containing protein [Raineyella antarctica]